MQRCPKCGRTYEDNAQKFCTHDGGRLAPDSPQSSATAPTAYDLNQTIRTEDTFDPEATVTRMPDLNKTVSSLPTTEIRERETGPATPPPSAAPYQSPPPSSPQPAPTVMYQQPPAQQQPPTQQPRYYEPTPQPASGSAQQPHAQPQYQYPPRQPEGVRVPSPAAAPRARSRVPLIIGLVLLLLAGGAAAWYFLIYKKSEATANSNANVANANASANENANSTANANATANTNANTATVEPPPPPNATRFANSAGSLDGKLAEYFSDFSFYYPNTWERDPRAGVSGASNFIKVERRLPPDFTQENFAVSWYESKGTFEQDEREVFPKLVESLKSRYSKSFPEFEVLNEGETAVNGIKGYEFRFQSVSRGTEKGDITLWGRVIFLPPGIEGQKNGIQLLMLTTSLAPELKSADDVGVKGELPVILNSFKVGNNR